MRILLLTGFVFFSCLSCQTIHYTNNSQVPLEYEYSKWHHYAINGLIDFKEPVNLSQICSKKDWKAVRTQIGFLNGLVNYVAQFALSRFASIPVQIYSSQTADVSCQRQEQL